MPQISPKPFDDEKWIFEVKWDGIRALAEVKKNGVKLYSEDLKLLNSDYPLIVQELQKLGINAFLDGEIVVINEEGKPDPEKLKNYSKNPDNSLCYYVFDILYHNNQNVCNKPLLKRKEILRNLIPEGDIVKYTDHIEREGIAFFEAAKELNLKAIIAKNITSIYQPGKASSAWLVIENEIEGDKKGGNMQATKAPVISGNDKIITLDKVEVKVTHFNKVYFPDDHITKGMVVDYYLQMADILMPYLKDRPQSLKRNPNGIKEKGFFHKDAGDEAPQWVESVKIYSESTDKDVDYILCNNKATLTYMNNLGCIEINPWHSTTKSLDNPDYLIIDLDPSEKNTFQQVVETAQAVKQVLDKAGAVGYCKTSGATGLHIYIPLGAQYPYETAKDFAALICMITHDLVPEITSLERSLAKRGNNKIYLDHLQNRKAQTIATVYSARPHPGATVSTPLEWDEVNKKLNPADYNIFTVPSRVKSKGDLFKGILGDGVDIAECLKALGAEE